MRRAALTREEMLDRLLEIFRRDGYERASTVELMRAIGLQKGSLYHHFPGGKAEMAQAVLDHVDALFEDMVFAPLRTAPTAEQGVAAMCRAIDLYFASGAKACLPALMGLSAVRDQFGQAIEAYFVRWIDSLAEALSKAGSTPDQARYAAERVVADLQGGIVLARALNRSDPFLHALQRATAAATPLACRPAKGHL